MSTLPPLDAAAQAHADTVTLALRAHIAQAGGWVPFDDWMGQALYAPGLGYYAAGAVKLAVGGQAPTGDFVTAPELSPLYGRTVAFQVAQVLQLIHAVDVLEFGAGSGALAECVLMALDDLGIPARYQILEVAADLKARQQARLARFGDRVRWLDALPPHFEGCVLANEVLDAMPVKAFAWNEQGEICERGVVATESGGFDWALRPAGTELAVIMESRMPPLPGYASEVNLQAEAWVRGMGSWLHRGVALLIDYGFPGSEFYHPQRAGGTLMCHLRHVSHADPFHAPGVQDITAHVDFTAVADAALEGGLDVLGFTSQARFLTNSGILQLLAQLDAADIPRYAQATGPVQKLLAESEMGELFKVMAVGRGVDAPLLGFLRGDRRERLERFEGSF